MIRFSTMGKREHERGHIQGEQSISACIQPKHDKKQPGKWAILSRNGAKAGKERDFIGGLMSAERNEDKLQTKKNPSLSRRVSIWQGRRDSNSRHPVLETGALPTELRP